LWGAVPKLTVKLIQAIKDLGRYGDGGGLYLEVGRTGSSPGFCEQPLEVAAATSALAEYPGHRLPSRERKHERLVPEAAPHFFRLRRDAAEISLCVVHRRRKASVLIVPARIVAVEAVIRIATRTVALYCLP
jgi:hypothetical protein